MLSRLKQRIRLSRTSRDKTTSTTANPPSDGSTASTLTASSAQVQGPTEKHGLFSLGQCVAPSGNQESYDVDIIAVHGLNGDAYKTWTHKNGILWLRDLLRDALPGSRVYTYGYPSHIFFSKSFADVHEFSLRLLSSIRDIQEDEPGTRARPIILLCHSLGGIVCKQALVFAHEDNAAYGEVLQRIIGIVFFGTPHRGSETADLGKILGAIVNVCSTPVPAVRTDLLEVLAYDSKRLHELALSARHRLKHLQVVSFYETERMPPFSTPIVEKTSSILEIPDESITALYANHRDMCKFERETSDYKTVLSSIKRIARSQRTVQREVLRRDTHSSQKSFSDEEQRCIALLRVHDVLDYFDLLPKPAKGTFEWMLNLSSFNDWVNSASASLIWVTGHPGCGKTMLSAFVARRLQNSPSTSANVCIYFCDDKISTQKDAKSILIGIILQIVRRHKSLIRYVKTAYQDQGSNLTQSFTVLWAVLMKILVDQKLGPSFIILDALDECEKTTRNLLLGSIGELIERQNGVSPAEKTIKFFLTSRPGLDVPLVKALTEPRIHIDEGREEYGGDLRLFISQRVDEISEKYNCTPEVRNDIEAALVAKAGHTFLWLHMVLTSLEESLLASKQDFLRIINTIPTDLRRTYQSFLAAIPASFRDAALVFIKLVIGSPRPLHLDELNVAFTISSTHGNVRDVTDHCQSAVGRTVQAILGPLVRISDSHVSLIHQSAKEFLLDPGSADGRFPGHPIIVEDAALVLASACVRYLLLEDFTSDLFSAEDSSIECSPVLSLGPPDLDDPGLLGNDLLFQDARTLDSMVCTRVADKYCFYRYAAMHWTEHLRVCESVAPASLIEGARTLLNSGSYSSSNWSRFLWAESGAAADVVRFDELSAVEVAAYFGLLGIMSQEHQEGSVDEGCLNRALYWAARRGHSRCVQYLLQHEEVDPNLHHIQGQTSLTAAATEGHADCVGFLLDDERTAVNSHNAKGRTSLSLACGHGHISVVELLRKRKDCSLDQQDNSGSTPLMWAVGGDYTAIISLLLDSKADTNARDNAGRTAASWAAGYGLEKSLELLIKDRRADLNMRDNNGKTPLIWAAANGRAETAALLARRKAVDKGAADRDGRNAISWASVGGHATVLKTLLKYSGPGAAAARDRDGWSALAWAVHTDAPRAVEALIATGQFDVDERDRSGRTALWWAVEYGQINNVAVLLQEGADARIRSGDGVSAEDMARSRGRLDIVDELRSHVGERAAEDP